MDFKPRSWSLLVLLQDAQADLQGDLQAEAGKQEEASDGAVGTVQSIGELEKERIQREAANLRRQLANEIEEAERLSGLNSKTEDCTEGCSQQAR
eukprot:1840414-Karenia_brevis.AAC.1